LRDIFGKTVEQMTTVAILEKLHKLPEAPWADLKGKPITDRGLAFRLREYGVKSKNLNMGGDHRPKGYAREDLHDVWERYLPPSPQSGATAATSATNATQPDFQGSGVADVAKSERSVADNDDQGSADEYGSGADVAEVADVPGDGDEEVF
jgi:hypothetical protein